MLEAPSVLRSRCQTPQPHNWPHWQPTCCASSLSRQATKHNKTRCRGGGHKANATLWIIICATCTTHHHHPHGPLCQCSTAPHLCARWAQGWRGFYSPQYTGAHRLLHQMWCVYTPSMHAAKRRTPGALNAGVHACTSAGAQGVCYKVTETASIMRSTPIRTHTHTPLVAVYSTPICTRTCV